MLHLAGLTIVGMPLLAIVIDYFFDGLDLKERIFVGEPIYIQIGIGIVVGLVAGFLAAKISEMKFMQKVSSKYTHVLENLKLTNSQIVFISICAGLGEEILFRGAIQYFFGIVITAILFVAIHGYLNPKDWRISIYGLFMTVVICGLGWLNNEFGIWTAITAHTLIDIYLLREVVKGEKA